MHMAERDSPHGAALEAPLHRNLAMQIRLCTYNIHQCRGLDRRVDPARIVRVLREVNADVIALQEVLSRPGGKPEENQSRYLAEQMETEHYFAGKNWRRGEAAFGNVVLSRFPVLFSQNYSLSWRSREPRGCLRVDIELPGARILHLFNLHLGLSWRERRAQGRMLLNGILRPPELRGPRVVVGDFNEWTRGLATRLLSAEFRHVDLRRFFLRTRSYPGLLPLVHLDNIYYDPKLHLESFRVHRSRATMLASDHVPLIAEFSL
jgi:endonuclease/exonuclease/phosphatase family metal-dependent hydrolase